jgi:hypothetical protein
VVLGGGVLGSRAPVLLDRVVDSLAVRAPHAHVTVVSAPPVLGAALAGLDLVDAPTTAAERLRAHVT